MNRTGDIGLFKLKAEVGVASGVRRVEATTGESALDWVRQREQILKEVSSILKGSEEDAADRVEKLLAQQRELERQLVQLQSKLAGSQSGDIESRAQKVNGVTVVASRVEGVDDKALREMADRLRDRNCSPQWSSLVQCKVTKWCCWLLLAKMQQKVIMLVTLSSKLLRSWVVVAASGQISPRLAEKMPRVWMKRCKRCMS